MTRHWRERLEAIEAGYEFCLAYAAQGRTDDAGIADPADAGAHVRGARRAGAAARERGRCATARGTPPARGVFLDAVKRDAAVAHGAIGLVLDRGAIGSLLVDNLNASIHLRALLTDLFLIDQARK